MNTWFSKGVGDGVDAFKPGEDLDRAFIAYATAAHGKVPPGLGVFSRHDLQANLVTFYFSPEATPLAMMFGAHACEAPQPGNRLALLVGDSRCWELHFPGYIASRGWQGD
jgi:hypothetical protein